MGNTWAVNASSTNKLARKGYWYNGSGSTVYKKLGGLVATNEENVFMLQARAGELIIISVGHGDGSQTATPKIKRLLNVYSKIIGFTLVGTNIIVATSGYSHECVLTQIAGTSSPTITVTDSNATEYNSGTAITIET